MSSCFLCKSAGAGGIYAMGGKQLLVSGEPAACAGQVVKLLEDPKFRAELSSVGPAQVTKAHRWPQSMKILEQIA